MQAGVAAAESAQRTVTLRRIGAALIDLVPLVVLFLVMAGLYGDLGPHHDPCTGSYTFSANLTGLPLIAYSLLCCAYFFLFEAVGGRTPGKYALGLRVCDRDGRPCGIGRSLARNLVRLVDWLPCFYLVGVVTVVLTKRDERLGDLVAKTVVRRER